MKNIKLLLVALAFFGLTGLVQAAPANNEYITPSVSIVRGGVISNSGTTCNAQVQQSIAAVGSYLVKGIMVGSTGTAQCASFNDLANCQGLIGSGQAGSFFEACSAANTSTYFDFSNSPIRVTNGIVVTTSRTDGFTAVYTQ